MMLLLAHHEWLHIATAVATAAATCGGIGTLAAVAAGALRGRAPAETETTEARGRSARQATEATTKAAAEAAAEAV